ncbi:MAG: hypothetical protein ACRD21_10330 [Vicinamibacteria bacterium]
MTVSLVEPATAAAQYFHGNCFAGFSVGVDLRIEETRRVGIVLSRISYRITDQGSGQGLADEALDRQAIDERYGERSSIIPASGTRQFRLGAITSGRPVGPIVVSGEIEALDENDQRVVESFQLTTPVVVDDPGPPGGGACSAP